MPKNTKVEKCVKDVGDQIGINKYAVCQASTGESYATGKKIKKDKSLVSIPTDQKSLWFALVKELRNKYRTKGLESQEEEK